MYSYCAISFFKPFEAGTLLLSRVVIIISSSNSTIIIADLMLCHTLSGVKIERIFLFHDVKE